MEPSMTPSPDVIPEKNLKMWNIFSNVGTDGEEILKTVKLAHIVDNGRGFVVTTTDETYSFIIGEDEDDECKISKIGKLSGIRVKKFFTGEQVNFAATEDGSLFSWSNELGRNDDYNPDLANQLGRYVSCNAVDKIDSFCRPALVTGSLTGVKVRQVVVPEESSWTVAVTVGGDVYQWGEAKNFRTTSGDPWKPILISKEHFNHQDVISVARSDHVGVALTSKRELFQWEFNQAPKKVLDVGSVPFKKITGRNNFIFALTATGEMYYLEADGLSRRRSDDNSTVWKTVSVDTKIEDIASSTSMENVVVVKLKNNDKKHLTFSSHKNENPNRPSFKIFKLPNGASMDEHFSQYGGSKTISAKIELPLPPPPRRLCDAICNLWENKRHVDVTFSVQGKLITAHKCILAERSEYFEIMFSKEWNEAKGGIYTIEDTKHDIFEALLFYIYSDKIKFGEHEYENIFDLMKLADSYCDINIRHECEKILFSNINLENAFFLVRNASSVNAPTLEGKVIEFIVENQFLVNNSSPQEVIDLVGMEAFQKISVALLDQ